MPGILGLTLSLIPSLKAGGTITVKSSALAILGDMANQQLENAGAATDDILGGIGKFFGKINWKIWVACGVSLVIFVILLIISMTSSVPKRGGS